VILIDGVDELGATMGLSPQEVVMIFAFVVPPSNIVLGVRAM
jgi:hypothetical protein